MSRNRISQGTIAVREGDYKLVHYLVAEKTLLFNLKEDPGELNNLFDVKPGKGQHLLDLIEDSLLEVNEKIMATNKK